MEHNKTLEAITSRYNGLAGDSCCLSCGGASGFARAALGETCVDLGSGRGSDALRLASQVGSAGFVHGIDATPAMIEKAQSTAKRLGVSNVEFIVSELDHLPLPSASVDCVISNCTINHVADKTAVWKEIMRILKPGGRFIVSDIYASAPVPDQFKNDPVKVSECWAGADTRENYLHTVLQAGFVNVTIIEESAPYKKGEIEVASFTVAGIKKSGCSCGTGCCS